ncbi:MAG: hypothetical protein ACJAT9_000489 [Polaribacter sp.]|jgi:hypothetical protein
MKNYKFTFLIILGLLLTSCNLEEEPPFLANDNVYSSASNATSALFGIYEAMVQYEYYGNEFLFLTNVNSGLMVTRRTGNNNKNSYNSTLSSLNPTSGLVAIENSWIGIYQTIGRANDAINSATVFANPSTSDELIINDVIGQAYFLRAFNYFNLVRLWGEIPLRVTPTTTETIHLAKSPIKDVYAQIIEDVKRAQQLMNGAVAIGTPKPQAADMLLSKVYMTLATASSDAQDSSLNYWQLAHDEAIKAYGAYSLNDSYDNLFLGTNGNNTEESIFELQSVVGATLDHTRAFTPNWYTKAATFGWFKINIENYDLHAATYSSDPRLATTYVSTWTRGNNGSTERSYPTNTARSSFGNSFPYLFKLGSRDPNNAVRETNKNFKIYRYADLLLMLSEISNELQNGKEITYVSEVLDRVGLTPHIGYSGGQDSFRAAIMREYQFELIGEGHDWFNNRRRGYNHFLNNIIIPHNTAVSFKGSVDVVHATEETIVMSIPIAVAEINANNEISN